LNILISQGGSAATEFRCCERFHVTVFCSLSVNPKVKELLKWIHICQSYRKNKSGTIFMAHGVYHARPDLWACLTRNVFKHVSSNGGIEYWTSNSV